MNYKFRDLINDIENAKDILEYALDSTEELEERVEELEEQVENQEERIEELEEENEYLKIDAKEYFLTLQKNKLIEMILNINDLETIVKLQDFIDNENIKNELVFEQTE